MGDKSRRATPPVVLLVCAPLLGAGLYTVRPSGSWPQCGDAVLGAVLYVLGIALLAACNSKERARRWAEWLGGCALLAGAVFNFCRVGLTV